MDHSLNEVAALFNKLDERLTRAEFIEESLNTRALDLENIGWTRLYGQADDDTGLTLDTLHQTCPNLRDAAGTNPLHKRGAQLRHAYIFGRGMDFPGITPDTQKLIDNPYNISAMFSVQAYATNNLALFTDGNLFVLRDEKTKILTIIPLSQITGTVTDPDDASRVRYFQRSWSDGKTVKDRWYPVARYKKSLVGRGKRGKGINKTITIGGRSLPVAQDQVIYHHATQRQAGWIFGVPDSLAAAVWSVAYSNYLTDNSTLVKALSQFAFTLTSATKAGRDNAAVAVATPGVGGTSVLGSGTALGSVGVPSAQVDFSKGQPLAAMVAASFGVPVVALLSSSGASGGSYGAEATLDEPTSKGMSAEQDSWTVLYDELIHDLGSPDAKTTFPNISVDPIYRQSQSIAEAYMDGRIHQDEAREATLKLLDVIKKHDTLPKPDKFNAGGDKNDKSNPTPSQGNTGAIPGGVNQDNGDHSTDGSSN